MQTMKPSKHIKGSTEAGIGKGERRKVILSTLDTKKEKTKKAS